MSGDIKTEKAQKLKPCPFCGNAETTEKWTPYQPLRTQTAWISCDICGAAGPKKWGDSPHAEARSAWNRQIHNATHLENERQLDIGITIYKTGENHA